MTITKDHIGGLVFLCLSVAYGYYARDIPLLPGDEFEPFTARSVPNALAWIGGVLSLALIVTAKSDTANTLRLAGLDFGLVSKLLILVVLFGLALDWLGFLLATVLFLVAGYWLLGERRPKMLLVASVPFAVGIWFVLTQLLDIYLAKGKFFTMLMGG